MSIDHENGIKTPNGKIYKKMDIYSWKKTTKTLLIKIENSVIMIQNLLIFLLLDAG
jgi:hypothetical protein